MHEKAAGRETLKVTTAGMCSWTVQLDGAAGRCSWTVQLDGAAGRCSWTVELDGAAAHPLASPRYKATKAH